MRLLGRGRGLPDSGTCIWDGKPTTPARKYGLDSRFCRFRPYFLVPDPSVGAEMRPRFEFLLF